MVSSVSGSKLVASKAAAAWAKLTGGNRPNRSTIIRWIKDGTRGRKLRASMIGGRWYIALESLREFYDFLNADAGAEASGDAAGRAIEKAHAVEAMREMAGMADGKAVAK
jgi:hypothetical protein